MELNRKIKVLVIADHPLSPSGVGTQTKYICETLVQSGKFQVICLGGAVQHGDRRPMQFNEFGEDWITYPVDGYGNAEIVRSTIRNHKPDILWFMTDPRFYYWLWQIENEVRPLMPMVYYHVWDNYPYPRYNKPLYESTDVIATISKVTHDIVKTVAPNVEELYIPHAVDTEIFKRMPDDMMANFRRDNFPGESGKTIFFWNNRNARRKQSGTLVWWFKDFLDEVGQDKAILLMHTDPKDENGQDLNVIIKDLGLDGSKAVRISQDKLPPQHLAALYNCADATINIADAEGFGLGTMESLACETPIIVNMTGGLQEQVTDGKEWFGVGIQPASKAIIGSQQTPYIYEDRVSREDFIKALKTIHEMKPIDRREMGKKGREYIMKNYNFPEFRQRWIDLMLATYEKHGSWDTRKNYKSWELRTV